MATSLDAGPTLKDIFFRHGLEEKDLERVCPPHIRDTIASKIIDWKMAGRYLGFPAEKLAAIDRENDTEDQRKVALLDSWGKREGRGASFLKLADALHRRERADLVELLCINVRSLNRSNSDTLSGKELHSLISASIGVRIDTLQKQFRGLHRQLISELKEGRVSVEEVLEELTWMPIQLKKEYESTIQQMLPTLEEITRITTLMNRLNPLFTFIDYGLLDHLISNLGSKELKEDMTSFVDRVCDFMRETTVGEIIDCFPGDAEPHVDYSKLKVKFKDDPKTYTLERLNNFRRKFCSTVRLSEFIFGLISLEPTESFFATWLFPTVAAPELMKAVRNIDEHFYELEHIMSVSVDQEQLYPLPVKAIPSASVSASVIHMPMPGDLIMPTPSLVSSVLKKTEHLQLKSSGGDSVNIITIGWEDAAYYASGIIGQYRDGILKLWDFSNKGYWVPFSTDKMEFESKKMEELQIHVQRCHNPEMVIVFEYPVSLGLTYRSSEPEGCYRMRVVGLTIPDVTKLFGESVWNNAVIVRPFTGLGLKSQDMMSEYKKLLTTGRASEQELILNSIEPEVISNIPIVPINAYLDIPTLPDRIDWLSPLWDACLLRMKETVQNSFLKANANRIKLSTTGKRREDSHIPLAEQAILYVPGPDTSNAPIRSAVSKLLGTEVAGPLGTTEPTKKQKATFQCRQHEQPSTMNCQQASLRGSEPTSMLVAPASTYEEYLQQPQYNVLNIQTMKS